jgi:hypothetical protein
LVALSTCRLMGSHSEQHDEVGRPLSILGRRAAQCARRSKHGMLQANTVNFGPLGKAIQKIEGAYGYESAEDNFSKFQALAV